MRTIHNEQFINELIGKIAALAGAESHTATLAKEYCDAVHELLPSVRVHDNSGRVLAQMRRTMTSRDITKENLATLTTLLIGREMPEFASVNPEGFDRVNYAAMQLFLRDMSADELAGLSEVLFRSISNAFLGEDGAYNTDKVSMQMALLLHPAAYELAHRSSGLTGSTSMDPKIYGHIGMNHLKHYRDPNRQVPDVKDTPEYQALEQANNDNLALIRQLQDANQDWEAKFGDMVHEYNEAAKQAVYSECDPILQDCNAQFTELDEQAERLKEEAEAAADRFEHYQARYDRDSGDLTTRLAFDLAKKSLGLPPRGAPAGQSADPLLGGCL
ncbi:hypothetical protein FWG76_00415 [Candidatus Saccharibacteria bacterium]|nr:hypothetical protein [Candidatus Saccharibacteria bacterium]